VQTFRNSAGTQILKPESKEMNSSWTQTYSFKVVDEAGSEDLVYVYTLSEESTYLDGHIQRRDIGKAYKLAHGQYVNHIGDGSLVEAGTGRKLHAV